MPPKKDKKAAKEKEQKEEAKAPEKTEKECQLEEELQRVEEAYRTTRARVNELRVQNHTLKDKSIDIQNEAKEYLTFIDKKRETSQNHIAHVHDDQKATLARLEREDAHAEEAHKERIAALNEEMRLALFKRSGLKDQLLNLSDAINLKEKNDKRINELHVELARKKVDDADMLQDMKAECLRAQKQFKMASQEAAREAKTQLKIDAHRIIKERTTTARKTNKQLREQLIKHIDETKVLAVQRKVLEAQCRDLQAEINCLKSFKRR